MDCSGQLGLTRASQGGNRRTGGGRGAAPFFAQRLYVKLLIGLGLSYNWLRLVILSLGIPLPSLEVVALWLLLWVACT